MGISGIPSQVVLALVQGTLGSGGGQPGQALPAPSSLPGSQELAQVRVALEAQALTEATVGQQVNTLA